MRKSGVWGDGIPTRASFFYFGEQYATLSALRLMITVGMLSPLGFGWCFHLGDNSLAGTAVGLCGVGRFLRSERLLLTQSYPNPHRGLTW